MTFRYAAAAACFAAPLAFAQSADRLEAPPPDIAGPIPVWSDAVPAPVPAPDFSQSRRQPATFVVDYGAGFPVGSEQREAFQAAVDIWAQLLTSAVPIRVEANFNPLDAGVLGSAGPSRINGFVESGEVTWYGAPLADAITGVDQTPGGFDIRATFNSTFSDWYFGTDLNAPNDKYDFVSVVLHELGHGLGFFGSAAYDDGVEDGLGNVEECSGTAGDGCWGIDAGGAFGLSPIIYDRFVEDAAGVSLLDAATYPQNSQALGDLLISNDLYFDGPNVTALGQRARIDAINPFRPGSSFSHLDENVYPGGSQNALMTRSISNGEIVRTPGPITCRLFQDIGWTVDVAACDGLPVPVELAGFDAVAEGARVRLAWDTQSETNNAGFEVEARQAGGLWSALGFVEGRGTTAEPQRYAFETDALAPGTYAFRLRQLDLDGTATVAAEVEAQVGLRGAPTWLAAFPNPFAEAATVRFAVERSEGAEVVAYDVLGRPVATLYAGTPPAGETVTARLDGSALAPGLYVVRLQTESGRTETRRLVKR